MKDQNHMSQAEKDRQFAFYFDAEIERKEKLMNAFEKLEQLEKTPKNGHRTNDRKRYERTARGSFFIQEIGIDYISLIDESENFLGKMQINQEVKELIEVTDVLEAIIGYRDGFWRIRFLTCILNSVEDFIPTL